MNIHFYLNVLSLISMSFFLYSCSTTSKEKGLEYFPDMAYTGPNQTAYEYYDPNPNFKNQKTSQPPVPGTIPRGFKPNPFPDRGKISFSKQEVNEKIIYTPNLASIDLANKQKDAILAGQNLSNPLPLTQKNINEGKKLYQTYCSSCHGLMGKADAPISPLLGAINFDSLDNNPKTKEKEPYPPGRWFYVITMGYSSMPAYAHISWKDRWKIIHYIENNIYKK